MPLLSDMWGVQEQIGTEIIKWGGLKFGKVCCAGFWDPIENFGKISS